MNKRGAELTMNVIVIAVILLITVAVVISFLFSQSGKTQTALNNCESKGGQCVESTAKCFESKGTPLPGFECKEDLQKTSCCYIPSK